MPDLGELLKDIHPPVNVSWWPPALGWWLVLLFAMMAIAAFVFVIISRKRKAGIRVALKALEELYCGYKKQQNSSLFIREASIIMRRLCITYYHRSKVAGLTGIRWLELLDFGLKNKPFSTGIGKIFAAAPYAPERFSNQEVNVAALYTLCIKRIKSI